MWLFLAEAVLDVNKILGLVLVGVTVAVAKFLITLIRKYTLELGTRIDATELGKKMKLDNLLIDALLPILAKLEKKVTEAKATGDWDKDKRLPAEIAREALDLLQTSGLESVEAALAERTENDIALLMEQALRVLKLNGLTETNDGS